MRVHSVDSVAFQNFATAAANVIAKRSDVMAKLEDKAPDVANALKAIASGKHGHQPPSMPRPPVAQPTTVAVVARKVAAAPGQILPRAGAPARILTKIDAAGVPAAHANASAHAQAASPNGNAFGVTRGAPAPSAATLTAASTALSDGTDERAAVVAPADLGKTLLEAADVAPDQPTLQVRLQYVALANRLLDVKPNDTREALRTTESASRKAEHRVDVSA